MFYIYFNYLGTVRGRTPIAGPFDTKQEAEEHAAKNGMDLRGPNYWVGDENGNRV